MYIYIYIYVHSASALNGLRESEPVQTRVPLMHGRFSYFKLQNQNWGTHCSCLLQTVLWKFKPARGWAHFTGWDFRKPAGCDPAAVTWRVGASMWRMCGEVLVSGMCCSRRVAQCEFVRYGHIMCWKRTMYSKGGTYISESCSCVDVEVAPYRLRFLGSGPTLQLRAPRMLTARTMRHS